MHIAYFHQRKPKPRVMVYRLQRIRRLNDSWTWILDPMTPLKTPHNVWHCKPSSHNPRIPHPHYGLKLLRPARHQGARLMQWIAHLESSLLRLHSARHKPQQRTAAAAAVGSPASNRTTPNTPNLRIESLKLKQLKQQEDANV